jgi:hypothetical protein
MIAGEMTFALGMLVGLSIGLGLGVAGMLYVAFKRDERNIEDRILRDLTDADKGKWN